MARPKSPERLVIKVCPLCGEERQVSKSEFARTGHTRCRRCMIKTSRFNLKGPKR